MNRFALVISAVMASHVGQAYATDGVPIVAADIAPVHGVVAAVMEGVGEPALLLEPTADPHHSGLRPSAIDALTKSDIVVTAGPSLSPGLAKAVAQHAGGADGIVMTEIEGMTILELGEGHDHDHHDHGGHDDHGDHGDHGDDHHAEAEGIDPHLWLDPRNAVALAEAVASALSVADPDRAPVYAENLDTFRQRAETLTTEETARLEPLGDRVFGVEHDALGYFTARFGLQKAVALADFEGDAPGPQELAEAEADLRETGATCVLTEGGKGATAKRLAERIDAGTAEIDLLGADVPLGPDHYVATIRALSAAIAGCLTAGAS